MPPPILLLAYVRPSSRRVEDDAERPGSFESILLALFEESFAADAQGFCGAADLVVRGFESRGDDLAFDLFERPKTGQGAGCARSGSPDTFRKVLGLER